LHEVVNFSDDADSVGVISWLARRRAAISHQSEIQGSFQVVSSFLHSLLSRVMPILSTIGTSQRGISEYGVSNTCSSGSDGITTTELALINIKVKSTQALHRTSSQ